MDQVHVGFDFSPLASYVIQILGAALFAVGTWAIGQLAAYLGRKSDVAKAVLDKELQDQFTQKLWIAIAAAEAHTGKLASEYTRNVAIGTNSTFLSFGVSYFLNHWPELVKKAGLTPEKVTSAILARLGPASTATMLGGLQTIPGSDAKPLVVTNGKSGP